MDDLDRSSLFCYPNLFYIAFMSLTTDCCWSVVKCVEKYNTVALFDACH